MTKSGIRLLKFIARAHGHTRAELVATLKCSPATLARYRRDAAGLGVVMECSRDPREPIYRVRSYGPFDITKLRQVVLEERPY